jgi:hypothetical protein
MADNVQTQTSALATIPDATVIATDEVAVNGGSSAHVQYVKLVSGAANATEGIPGDAANGLDVDITRSALPTGAATAAKQPALGTAGSPSADVISIQGVASGTVVPVSDGGGSVTVDAPVGTPAFVRLSDGSAAITTLPVSLASVPSHAVTNAGTFAVQAALTAGTNTNEVVGDVAQDAAIAGNPVSIGLRASTATPSAMSADGDAVYAWADRNGAQIVAGRILDDAAFTPGTDRLTPAGFFADETATDSVDEGDLGAARITLDRKQISTPYAHATAGGATPYKNLDVDESEDEIKATAGKLFWVHVINLSAAVLFIKFYNATAANVTVGTTTPVLTFPIPTLGDTNGAGFTLHFGDIGVQFSTAITVAATTGLADNNSGAPGTNEVVLNAGYL